MGSQGFLDGFPFRTDGFEGFGFHGAIESYHIPAFGSQLCAASAFPALDTGHQRLFEAVVHGVYQIPCPTVAEPQFARSGGDGPGAFDSLQQIDFARTQGDVLFSLDADTGAAGEFGLFRFSQGIVFTFWRGPGG